MIYDFNLFDIAKAILDGQNPIRVWREYRNIPPQIFAEKVEMPPADLRECFLNQFSLFVS